MQTKTAIPADRPSEPAQSYVVANRLWLTPILVTILINGSLMVLATLMPEKPAVPSLWIHVVNSIGSAATGIGVLKTNTRSAHLIKWLVLGGVAIGCGLYLHAWLTT